MNRKLCLLLAVSGAAAMVSACSRHHAYDASGVIGGQSVATTVDSKIARDYLKQAAAPSTLGRELRELISKADREPLSVPVLQRLSNRASVDLAALYFVHRVYRDPRSQAAQDAFHACLRALRGAARKPHELSQGLRSHLIAFVPGYAYRLDRTTGADFGRQRALLRSIGFQTALIETDELGTVESNARVIAQQIREWGGEHKTVLLVSASKGGPEAATALGDLLRPSEVKHVSAWLSIGGILRGSPYADRFMTWPKSWVGRTVFYFQGLDGDVISNLSTRVRRPLFARLRFPDHLLRLQYVGVPLSGQVSSSVRGRYEALKSLGPNDGLTLVVDELVPNGIVITDLGLDHYYRDPEIDLKTLALALVVLELTASPQEGAAEDHGF
ncbi:MAG: hypothetical protein AB1898_08025 [Acidobacteriota bacterium]